MRSSAFSSHIRPVLTGRRGAVAAAHPLACAAAQQVLSSGGNAVDATVAAQAVLCVVSPEACGLGGDAFFLIRNPAGKVIAVNGAGRAPRSPEFKNVGESGTSVTVPGIVHAWSTITESCGRMPLADLLAPAMHAARQGGWLGSYVPKAVAEQRARLLKGGAENWAVVRGADCRAPVVQPELAQTLAAIGQHGAAAFYGGVIADAMVRAVHACGGMLSIGDLAAHETAVRAPITIDWFGGSVSIQPPISQGVLLAIALRNLERLDRLSVDQLDHACTELTNAAFSYRDRAGEGESLLEVPLEIDLGRASRRGGPRAYLHTAGVAVADGDGWVVSSLLSLFDDFGSAIFVPECGIVLNNRAEGFTTSPNDAAPGKLPVHTLAPTIMQRDDCAIGLATPGADGQIQTLLQILCGIVMERLDLASAIDRPRWRSECGRLLIERGHPRSDSLAKFGHEMVVLDPGDARFGGLVCAGFEARTPFAVSDWRREIWSGIA